MTGLQMHKPCCHCNRTLRELLLEALLIDAGARVHPDPRECEHDFSPRKITSEITGAVDD